MPLYDYQCKQCQKITEVRHGFKDVYEQPCPACGGVLARVFNPAGIVFKGSGFYITDSRKASSSGGGTGSGDSSAPAAAAAPSTAAAAPAATESKKSDAA